MLGQRDAGAAGLQFPFDGHHGGMSAEVLCQRLRRRFLLQEAGAVLSRERATVLAPIPRPGKFLCIGLNYRDHAEESGMAVPEEYGGMGLPVLDTALVLEEIAKVCYPTAMAVMGEVGVQTKIIATYAPDEIKQRLLPGVCAGEIPVD